MAKSKDKETVTAHVKYGDVEQTFAGEPNDVWVGLNRFFCEMIPAFDIANKLTLTVDLHKLVEDLENIIAIAPEGPQVLVPKQRLTDSETLLLNLLAAYIGNNLGKLDRGWLTKEELQARLGKSLKITSTRLGELTRERLALKTQEGSYKITTKGVKQLQQEMLVKIRMKT